MIRFRTIPIPAEIAEAARRDARAPRYGHPAHTERATGTGPCRLCLRTFRVGEESRLLFTYDAFAGLEAYPSPGPIFVHADGCEPFSAPEGFPASLRSLPLTLEGYAPGRWPIARECVTDGDVESAIGRLFSHAAISYLHVRNTEAGCYIARIERVSIGGTVSPDVAA